MEKSPKIPIWKQKLNWEFWPMWLANLPLFFIWFWFALRSRHLLFFTTANPDIATGGFFGESKMVIYKKIPAKFLPKTIQLPAGMTFGESLQKVLKAGIHFPLVAKPDIGERGKLVHICKDETSLRKHLAKADIDWIIQDFVDFPLEATVFYTRIPGENALISSVCLKQFLEFTGDGSTSVEAWMKKNHRAAFQLNRFRKEKPELLAHIPPFGERIKLEQIGNHNLGTKFLDGTQHIGPEMTALFDRIASSMKNTCYGRFDLRCENLDSLKTGHKLKVLEFNGIGAEPAHIYDPKIPISQKYAEIFRHWRIIYRIYRQQKARNIRPESWNIFRRHYSRYRKHMLQIRQSKT